MLKPRLFLGIPVLEPATFDTNSNSVLDSRRLQQLTVDGKNYLGKFVDVPIDVASLKLLQANVFSLLQKFSPKSSLDPSELELIAIPDEPT